MSTELLTSMNQKLALLLVEMTALNSNLTRSTGKVNVPQNFDEEFESAKGTSLPGVVAAAVPADVELDADGLPWDERINAKSKTKKADGVWKRGKGIDDSLFNSVMVELKAKYSGSTVAAAPPGVAAAAAPPGVAAAAAPPGVVAAASPDKKQAMQNIALLTDEYGVDYALVLDALKRAFNVDSFDKLTDKQYPSANFLFTEWATKVRQSDEEIEQIIEFGADAGKVGVETTLSNNKVSSLAQVKYDAIDVVHGELKNYREQWEAYVNSK